MTSCRKRLGRLWDCGNPYGRYLRAAKSSQGRRLTEENRSLGFSVSSRLLLVSQAVLQELASSQLRKGMHEEFGMGLQVASVC